MKIRLTYANVVSTLALFAALGGSAYAATEISGRQIINGTITAGKLKPHTLTGKQLNMKELGTVRSASEAASATNAATATNADALGGISASGYALASSFATFGPVTLSFPTDVNVDGTQTLFQSGPFTFTGHCVEEWPDAAMAYVTVATTEPNSSASGASVSQTQESVPLNPGSPATIISGTPVSTYAVWAPDGTTISGAAWGEITNNTPTNLTCKFGGHAQLGG